MTALDAAPGGKLRIIHCFRSPVGGIFRHVRDLIAEQHSAGHEVGIICDNNTGGTYEENLFDAIRPNLSLGLHRLPMDRAIGPRDIAVMWRLYREIKGLNIDVLHSHGSKGGAYARIIGTLLRRRSIKPARLYCPHGGSVHYDRATLSGRIYFVLERMLERFTDHLIFVSQYERDGYFSKIKKTSLPHSQVRNGLTEGEFLPVSTQSGASDFLYIGMMRDLKGVDLFLQALPLVHENAGRPISAALVGDGPDRDRYKAMAQSLGDGVKTVFHDPMPARQAFGMGETLVVPSRAESLPYIVLEALAAQRPMIATDVGGIPEIYGPFGTDLVKPDDLDSLALAMSARLQNGNHALNTGKLAKRVHDNFSAATMAGDVMKAYEAALSASK